MFLPCMLWDWPCSEFCSVLCSHGVLWHINAEVSILGLGRLYIVNQIS
uniref:Uncharacterized protein n=1 Tax=Arundo donax TaxID=35708 RepID=A0A0A9BJB3_ARUDO